jgi:hypothetical protein
LGYYSYFILFFYDRAPFLPFHFFHPPKGTAPQRLHTKAPYRLFHHAKKSVAFKPTTRIPDPAPFFFEAQFSAGAPTREDHLEPTAGHNMAHQTLPSLATAMRFVAETERRAEYGAPTTGFLSGGGLSVDATRELAKCANGEHVSHDIIRDGIDALLQMKRDSFDHSASPNGRDYHESETSPDYRPIHPSLRPPVWNDVTYDVKPTVPSADEDSDEDGGYVPVAAEVPVIKKDVKPRKKPTKTKMRIASDKKTLPLPPPPANRPPTIWHSRKSELLPPPTLPTPDSPKSKFSVDEESDHDAEPQDECSEEEEDEEVGPAILHFSCIQCHRAKKRCNRTRPCTRCSSRGMEHECRYPDKHDPRSVLRACLRCWQTKKKCDRKQPACGKCDKVGVKCVYRRETAVDSPEVCYFYD